MKSRQVFGRNSVIFDHRTKRNNWSFEWFAESPFVRCFPIKQEFLYVSQHSMKSAHLFSSRPGCNSTAEVPSLILRTALSAIQFVSERWSVDVQWFQERSSQTLSKFTAFTENFVICCYQVTKIFCSKYGCASAFSARNPCNLGSLANLPSGSVYVYMFLLYYVIHFFTENFVIRIFKITNFSALGTTVPARLLQEALVI